jgi:protein-S-isoprenylcysteine O-methyltransferase Ste14
MTMHPREGEHPFGDIGQLILLAIFMVVWVGDSFFLHASMLPPDRFPLPLRLVLVLPVLVLAVCLIRSGHRAVDLDNRQAGVVTSGAFRYVRHPLYLGSILFFFCLAATTASLLSLALFAGIAFFYNHIAAYEEKQLRVKYASDYSDYAAKTGKWLPRIRHGDRIELEKRNHS